jgi:predicted HTH domain antitoxin
MDEMTTVEMRVPSDVLATLRARTRVPHSDEERLRVPLAVGLFADGTMSLAKAARMAGMTRYDFAMFLKDKGLVAYEYTEEEYREDLDFRTSARE